MRVYHGSDLEVTRPDTKHLRKNVDFGVGFYVTPLKNQAEGWCQRFKRTGKTAILSTYEMKDFYATCKVLEFKEYSEQWLDFIIMCRQGKDNTDYDIVIGGVANDKVFNTIELFFDGLIDKMEAIKRLQYEQPTWQICLRKQYVIDTYLQFIRSEAL